MNRDNSNNFFEDGFTSGNSFGNDDDFGFSNDGFGDNSGFGNGNGFNDNSGFRSDDFGDGFGDSSDDFFGNSDNSFGNDNNFGNDNGFNDGFNEEQNNQYSSNDFSDTNQSSGVASLSKKSYIIIAVGIGVLVLVMIVAAAVNKAASKKKNVEQVEVQQVEEREVEYKSDTTADDILGSAKSSEEIEQDVVETTEQPKVINNVKEGENIWTEITSKDAEYISFKEDYVEMEFTVTNIKHKARAVDASEALVVKTTLSGSISGLPGTYELDIPYNKGIKIEELGIGTHFKVQVQLGEFKGRTVVGDITY